MIIKYIVVAQRKGPNPNTPYRQVSDEFSDIDLANNYCKQLNNGNSQVFDYHVASIQKEQ